MSRRSRIVALGAASVALGVSPIAYGYLSNDATLSRQRDELATELPEKTSLLKARIGGLPTTSSCRGIAAKMLASELTAERIGEHFSRTAVSVAWRQGEKFLLREPGQPEPREVAGDDPSELPATAHKLLIQHAFLAPGVKRYVVFETFELGSRLDPRCW